MPDDNTKPSFDMEATLKVLREGKDLTGKDGILTPLFKQLTESAILAELDSYLAEGDDAPTARTAAHPRQSKVLRAF